SRVSGCGRSWCRHDTAGSRGVLVGPGTRRQAPVGAGTRRRGRAASVPPGSAAAAPGARRPCRTARPPRARALALPRSAAACIVLGMTNKGADDAAASGDATELELSSAVGDYLKAIWQLAGASTAATGDIARALGVTAPSVTGMLSRLRAQGLVQYQPHKGAELTEHGRREAMRPLRRPRLREPFMIGE